MSFAFQCAGVHDDAWPEEQHKTVGVMRRCTRCDKHGVAGYQCETCGHEDIDPAGRLVGHGEGKCELVEVSDFTAIEVRVFADDYRRWDAPGKTWYDGLTPEQHLAVADDLDALADRYEREAR